MAHIWASLLTRLDNDSCGVDPFAKKMEACAENFFQRIPKERCILFVEGVEPKVSVSHRTP